MLTSDRVCSTRKILKKRHACDRMKCDEAQRKTKVSPGTGSKAGASYPCHRVPVHFQRMKSCQPASSRSSHPSAMRAFLVVLLLVALVNAQSTGCLAEEFSPSSQLTISSQIATITGLLALAIKNNRLCLPLISVWS